MTRFGIRLICTALCAAFIAGVFPVSAQSGPAPSSQNTPRLRELDFSPFEAALASLSHEDAAAIGRLVQGGTIVDVQAALADGLTSEALTLFFLDRVRRYDDRFRTLLELNPQALEEARAADRLRAAGTVLGPLHGIPVTLKDNIETAGPMRTTAGAEILLDNVARADAPLVAQVRASGAVILGKANLSEFAGAITSGTRLGGASAVGGQVINPLGASVTGGSSAGSAAGVAATLTMVSVGTETSGSLVAPSAWHSVVGMKPSRDLVSGSGVVPLLNNNDSPGPIGRSVTDVAALLAVIDSGDADYLSGLRYDALDGVTVGMLNRDMLAIDGNAPLVQAASLALTAAGARLRPAELGGLPKQYPDLFSVLLAGGIRYDMMPYVAERNPSIKSPADLVAYNAAQPQRRIPFGETLTPFATISADLSPGDYAELAGQLRQMATASLDGAFAEKGAEVLVSLENVHSQIYATAGYPAVTVPLGVRAGGGLAGQHGFPAAGLPAGVTLIGKPGQDAKLLAYAFAFEQASRLRVAPVLP